MYKRYFTILFLIFVATGCEIVQAKTVDKEQIVFDISQSRVSYIDENGEIYSEKLAKDDVYTYDDTTYITLNALKIIYDTLDYGAYKEELPIVEIRDIYSGNELRFNLNTLMTEVNYNNSETNCKSYIKMNKNKDKVSVPLRLVFNGLGYSDDEIIYNSAAKAVSVNRFPLFETSRIDVNIEVRDFFSGVYSEKIIVEDKHAIESLVYVLNEEPFYQSTFTRRGGEPTYVLDFNNGTVLKIYGVSDCEVFIDGVKNGTYILPFKSFLEIEKFIDNADSGKISPNSWFYNLKSDDYLYRKKYIVCDSIDDDYSYLLRYLRSQIKDFDLKFKWNIEKSNKGIKLLFTSDEGNFSIRIFENYGAVSSAVEAEILKFK